MVCAAIPTLSLRGLKGRGNLREVGHGKTPVGSYDWFPKIATAASGFAMTGLVVYTATLTLSLRGGGLKADDVGHKGAPPVAESSDRSGWAGTWFCASKAQGKTLVPTRKS